MELQGFRTRGLKPKTVCRPKRKKIGKNPEDIDYHILGFRNPSVGWKIAEIYRGRSETSRGDSVTSMLSHLFKQPRSCEESEVEVVADDLGLSDAVFNFLKPGKKAVEENPAEQLMFYNSMCVRKMIADSDLNPFHPAIRERMQNMFLKGGEDAIESYLEDDQNIAKLRSLGA